MYFCHIENLACEEINEWIFSNPHLRAGHAGTHQLGHCLKIQMPSNNARAAAVLNKLRTFLTMFSHGKVTSYNVYSNFWKISTEGLQLLKCSFANWILYLQNAIMWIYRQKTYVNSSFPWIDKDVGEGHFQIIHSLNLRTICFICPGNMVLSDILQTAFLNTFL